MREGRARMASAAVGARGRPDGDLNSLARHARQLAPGDDASGLLRAAAELLPDVLGAEFSCIGELLPGESILVFRAGRGWTESLLKPGDTVQIAPDSLADRVLRAQTPIVVADLSKDTRFRPCRVLAQHGIASGICIPVLFEGKSVGVLGAFSRKKRGFSWNHLLFVEDTADLLSEVLARRRQGGGAES